MVRRWFCQGHRSIHCTIHVTSIDIAVAISIHYIVAIDKDKMICLLFYALRQRLMLVDAPSSYIGEEILMFWNASCSPLTPTQWGVSLVLLVMVMMLLLKAPCSMHLLVDLLIMAPGRARSCTRCGRLRHLHIVTIRRAQLRCMLLQLLPVLVIKIVDSI